jgi:hypothetical protein
MKKVLLFLFATGMALNAVNAQSTWIDYSVDAKISLKVPFKPVKADPYSVVARAFDSTLFVIRKVDMKVAAGLDSAALAQLAPTKQFRDDLKNSIMQSLKGFTFGDVITSTWHGYYSYYIAADNPQTRQMWYTFIVLIGDYQYGFIVRINEGRDPKLKDYFLHSIRLH